MFSFSGTPHHYEFAHVALRQTCAQNPVAFFEIMASEDRDAFLNDIWRHVCTYCDPEGEPGFSLADIRVEFWKVKNYPAFIVQMPEPRDVTEAYFVAIVLEWQIGKDPPGPDTRFHYFTLENSEHFEGSPRTVLCAWDGGVHINYMVDPPAHIQDFIEAIERML